MASEIPNFQVAWDQRQRLSNTIQVAIEDAAKTWGVDGEFFRPSPGQTWSHVAHRITVAVIDRFEGGLFLLPLYEESDV